MDKLSKNNLIHHHSDTYNPKNKALIRRMRIANILFPIIISVLLIVGFLLLQDFSNKEQNYIHLIKIGSNQRTLSQKILYQTSKISITALDNKKIYTDSLFLTLKNLKEGHKNLVEKSNILRISNKSKNSIVIQTLFDSLENHYQTIITESNNIFSPNFSVAHTDSLNQSSKSIIILEKSQAAFSDIMESIITIFEKQSEEKFNRLKIIEFAVVIIFILFIIGLAFFGIKPIIDKVKQAFFKVQETNAKFLEKNKILQASEEKLYISSKKLHSINNNLVITQEETKQKQKLLTQAERVAKMGSFIWDLQMQTIHHSDNLPYICRLEEDKMITPTIFKEIIHPDDFKINQKDFIETTSTQTKNFFTEYRARPPYLADMVEWKYYRAFAIINYNEEGKALQIIGTTQDVTEEIKQNQRVKSLFENAEKNKKYLEEAQKLAKIVSYDINIVSKNVNWSDSFSGVFATNKHEIPTSLTDFRKWVEPLDLKRIEQKWTEAIESKTRFNEIYRLTTPTEKLIYIKEKGHPYFDEEGNLIGKRGTLQDITKSEIARINIEQKSKQIKYQNDSFVSSINYAQRIQSALLGGTSEIQNIFKESFIFFVPKDIVSGDFYWYAEVDNRKIVVVADCTGHGVPGAFMSLLGTMLLNEIIEHRKITTPSHILEELQQEITDILKQKTTKNKDGMDISIAVVDEDIRVLEFAGARNPLVYIHKKQQENEEENMTVIKGDAISIGGRNKKVESNKYTNHVINLDDVEAFYLYSDGYQDQFGGENGTKFMSKSFRSLLYKTHSEKSMSHQRRALKTNLRDWMGRSQKQIDDICIIGITV